MFVHTSVFKPQAIIDVIEGKIINQQQLMKEAPKMRTVLVGTGEVFELGFMVHTYVMQPMGLKVKGLTCFSKAESSSNNT